MGITAHPFVLIIAIVLSLLSSWLSWRAFREKNGPDLLMGIGLGLPLLSQNDWRFWAAGLGLCAFGLWLKKNYGI